MKKEVCFIISGTGYSGAEIVLNRYLEDNEYIDPYFLIIFNNKKVRKIYRDMYGEDKIKCLNIIYNKNIFRFTIPLYIKLISNKLNKYFKSVNPEIIYVNNTCEGILCSKFINKSDKKSILHIHDMRECYKHPYNNYIIENYFKGYDKIITVSNATKKSWNGLNMEVVYNGLKMDYFKGFEIIDSVKEIAFIGSLNKRKGADYLIDSLDNLLIKTDVNITFVFRDYDKRMLNKLELIESKRIKILKNLSEYEIENLYSNIDLIIVPSRFDPLPTVIMEAEAKGKLVLGNNKYGIQEMINEKALLVDINSAKDLEEAIINTINMKRDKIIEYQYSLYNHSKKIYTSNNKKEKVNKIIDELISID